MKQRSRDSNGKFIRNDAPLSAELVAARTTEVEWAAKREVLMNGMFEAFGLGIGGGSAGFMPNQGSPFSEQISQATTIFKNLRYYLVSNFRQILSQVYCEFGLVRTIVDVPVDDALRGGVEIKSKQLSEDQIQELLDSLDRDDDLNIAGQALKWNRLFGGAGIIILTDQDPEEEFQIESLTDRDSLEFRAVDMWELYWDKQNTEGYDPAIQQEDFEFYSYYGEKVHKSRVMRMKGLVAPSFVRPRLRGWGLSVVEILVRSINQYLKATDLSFEVMDEFKLDVYRIKDLVSTLLSGQAGEQAVFKRLQIANMQKNYQNAIVLDKEDEYDHKQLSFAGLAEAQAGIRMQVASDLRMPLTKIFGISAAGFNSGEDDIEVYNGMVESEIRSKSKYHILRMCEIKSQVLFGFIPDDLSIKFKPLRVLSAEQVETVKTQKFTRALQGAQAGLLSVKEFKETCNKGELFDITLDVNDELDTSLADMAAQNKGGATDGSGGANNPDSKKTKVAPETKDAKYPNSVHPYSLTERAVRLINSPQFDKAAYEADGGDSWIDPRRKELFTNPGDVDEALWAKAKRASMDALGSERWQFITWWYKKNGGQFHSKGA